MRLAREFRRPDWRRMLAEMSATERGEWAEHFGKNGFSDLLLDAEFATLKSLLTGLVTGTHHDAEMFSLITDPESLHEKTDDELMKIKTRYTISPDMVAIVLCKKLTTTNLTPLRWLQNI